MRRALPCRRLRLTPLYARSDSVHKCTAQDNQARDSVHTCTVCDSGAQAMREVTHHTFVLAACKYIFHAARVQTGARDALAVFIRQEFSYGRGPQTGGTLKPANAYRRFAGVDGGMQRQELCLLSNRQSVVTVGN